MTVSPDGTRAAVSGWDGDLELLDLGTGRPVRPPVVGHEEVMNLAVFSPDGEQIVSAGWDGTVSLWDGRTGKLLAKVSAPARLPASAEFLPGGRDLVIASYDRGVYRWNTRIGQAERVACAMAGRNLTSAEWADTFEGRRVVRASCRYGDMTL